MSITVIMPDGTKMSFPDGATTIIFPKLNEAKMEYRRELDRKGIYMDEKIANMETIIYDTYEVVPVDEVNGIFKAVLLPEN